MADWWDVAKGVGYGTLIGGPLGGVVGGVAGGTGKSGGELLGHFTGGAMGSADEGPLGDLLGRNSEAAAIEAARIQQDAANNAINFNQDMYSQSRGDLAPFTGAENYNNLSNMTNTGQFQTDPSQFQTGQYQAQQYGQPAFTPPNGGIMGGGVNYGPQPGQHVYQNYQADKNAWMQQHGTPQGGQSLAQVRGGQPQGAPGFNQFQQGTDPGFNQFQRGADPTFNQFRRDAGPQFQQYNAGQGPQFERANAGNFDFNYEESPGYQFARG